MHERIGFHVTLERTLMENRYDSRLLGYYHCHGIGLLSYSHGGTVTQTE